MVDPTLVAAGFWVLVAGGATAAIAWKVRRGRSRVVREPDPWANYHANRIADEQLAQQSLRPEVNGVELEQRRLL